MIKSFFKSNYKYTFIFIVSTIIGGALVAYGSYGLTPATDSLKNLDAKKFILWIVVITIAPAGGRVLHSQLVISLQNKSRNIFIV